MIAIDKELIQVLFDKALVNPRLREGYDLRNSNIDIHIVIRMSLLFVVRWRMFYMMTMHRK